MHIRRSMFAEELLSQDGMDKGLSLAQRVHPKYQPVFEKLSEADRAAVALYFLPHGSKKETLEVTRPRVVKWYCPFADQREFPSGHRYSINVYAGCEHRCEYCYAAGYIGGNARCKNSFREDLIKDLDALDACDVPPAPVHLSNSTDALQRFEIEHRHCLFALERLAERRHRFTTVTLLTKNPAMLLDERYINALHRLNDLAIGHPRRGWFSEHGHSPLRIEVSLAFWSDEHRRLLDPGAPSVESRLEAIRALRSECLPVHLRIDPLFPRDMLPDGKRMEDFGLPDVQPLTDLESLVTICGEVGVGKIIYSVAKITLPRDGRLSAVMTRMKAVYDYLASKGLLVFRGGSWRLPESTAAEFVIAPFVALCQTYAMTAQTCKANLISTP
jgi:DNA repair photolyase